jgi:hypothetical protein
VVPLAAVDALQLVLQPQVLVLLGLDLLGNLLAVCRVQLGHQLRDEVLVLQRLLDRRQGWAMPLSLGRVRDGAMLSVAVAGVLNLNLDLPLQALQVEVAQGIGAQAAGLEVLVGGDVRVLLQQVRYPAED